MHKYFLIALFLGGLNARACDVCGCAVGPMNLGNVTAYGYHFIGFQSNFLQTSSYHEASNFSPSFSSKQRFISANLQGKFLLSKRWSIMGNLPIWNKESIELEDHQRLTGIGDLSAQVQFVLFQKSDSLKQIVLRAATGVKAPTGLWKDRNTEVQNLYPGSGSWDYPSSIQFLYNGNKKLLQADVNYLYRNYNAHGFRFGDSFSSSISGSLVINRSTFRAYFGSGIQYTLLLTDREKNNTAIVTNNHGQYGTLNPSLMFLIKKTMIRAQVGIPIYQELGDGNVHLYPTAQIQLIQLLQKKSK